MPCIVKMSRDTRRRSVSRRRSSSSRKRRRQSSAACCRSCRQGRAGGVGRQGAGRRPERGSRRGWAAGRDGGCTAAWSSAQRCRRHGVPSRQRLAAPRPQPKQGGHPTAEGYLKCPTLCSVFPPWASHPWRSAAIICPSLPSATHLSQGRQPSKPSRRASCAGGGSRAWQPPDAACCSRLVQGSDQLPHLV